jgi:hypothetical protein
MRSKITTILILVNVVGTLCAIGWALIWLHYGSLALTDTNLEAFRFSLTPEQGNGITRMASSMMQSSVMPLIVTNGCWLLLWLIHSVLDEKTQQRLTTVQSST